MAMRSFLGSLGLALLLTASPSAAQSAAHQPIIRGRPTEPAEMLGTVALVDASGGFLICSGTLVSPTVVVTAAHCFFDRDGFEQEATGFAVVVGALDLATTFPESSVFRVVSGARHPDFDFTSLQDDVGVLVLERPVESLVPVRIATQQEALRHAVSGASVILEGYGISDLESFESGRLLRATSTVSTSFAETLVAIPTSEAEGDSCFGDSGGPVYFTIDGEPTLAAATSRALPDAVAPCGEGGVYTLLGSYRRWFAKTSGDESLDGRSRSRCSATPDARGGSRPELALLALVGLALARRRLRGS